MKGICRESGDSGEYGGSGDGRAASAELEPGFVDLQGFDPVVEG